MLVAYIVLTSLTAAGSAVGAVLNFTHHRIPVTAAEQVQVSKRWIRPFGALFLAAACGLVAGFVIPPIGLAAAGGLTLYFIGAVAAHLRVRDRHFGPPVGALVLASATLVVTLVHFLTR